VSLASPAPRRELSPAVVVVRVACGPLDTANVRELDNVAFPPSSNDQQRADPGELEDGVAVGDIYLLERDDVPVAYLHLDRQTPGRVYVSGLAVHPDVQGGGLGKLMVDHFLKEMHDQWLSTAVVTITSPRNHVMLRLMFSRGFVGRWLIRDFFGPDRHRLCCQIRSSVEPAEGPMTLASATLLDTAFALMEEHQHVVRGLVATPTGPHFLMSREQPGEFLSCVPPG
jgi:ribosomal protein S18 acetylase RimI-like enzyme